MIGASGHGAPARQAACLGAWRWRRDGGDDSGRAAHRSLHQGRGLQARLWRPGGSDESACVGTHTGPRIVCRRMLGYLWAVSVWWLPVARRALISCLCSMPTQRDATLPSKWSCHQPPTPVCRTPYGVCHRDVALHAVLPTSRKHTRAHPHTHTHTRAHTHTHAHTHVKHDNIPGHARLNHHMEQARAPTDIGAVEASSSHFVNQIGA